MSISPKPRTSEKGFVDDQMTADQLASIRHSLGLTIAEMAAAMGVSYQQHYQRETGSKGISRTVARLAWVLEEFPEAAGAPPRQSVLIVDGAEVATITRVSTGDGSRLSNDVDVWVAIVNANTMAVRAGESARFARHHLALSWVNDVMHDRLEESDAFVWQSRRKLDKDSIADSQSPHSCVPPTASTIQKR